MAQATGQFDAAVAAGAERLAVGDAEAAVQLFDQAAALEPTRSPELWQRGLALYFASAFPAAAAQFAADMAVNDADVEEVVWKMAADTRAVGLKQARSQATTLAGPDLRAPMPQILDMWQSAGRDGVEKVLEAAEAAQISTEPPLHNRAAARAYGHYYIALFLDATGDLSGALSHYAKAAANPPDDFMGRIFRMHHRLAAAEGAACVPLARQPLGASALHNHSAVILGGWQLSAGHHDNYAKDSALASMHEHWRRGITALDMGDIYTGVEALIGEHLARGRSSGYSNKVRIHTKLVPDMSVLGNFHTTDEWGTYARSVLLRSKNRLGILRPLDLVQFHWWDWEVGDHTAAYGALCAQREAGLVNAVGVTNYDAQHLQELLDAGFPCACNQVQYSLLDRRVEPKLIPLCRQAGVSLLCYGVLAGGFLTDRWLGASEPTLEDLENRSLVKYKLVVDEFGGWTKLQGLLRLCREVADQHGSDCTIAQVAIGYILAQDMVGAAILGARNASHLGATVAATNLVLNDDELETLRAHVVEHAEGPIGPFFGLERKRSGKHGEIMRYELNQIRTKAHAEELTKRVELFLENPGGTSLLPMDQARFAAQLLEEASTIDAMQGVQALLDRLAAFAGTI